MARHRRSFPFGRECTAVYSVRDRDDSGLVPQGHRPVDTVAGLGLVVFISEAQTDEANADVVVPYPNMGDNVLTDPFNVGLGIHDGMGLAVDE